MADKVTLKAGERVAFMATNHRGETETRLGIFQGISFGSSPHYPEPGWLFEAYDLDKGAPRSFKLANIRGDTLTKDYD